jgi:hypothetical protein
LVGGGDAIESGALGKYDVGGAGDGRGVVASDGGVYRFVSSAVPLLKSS